MVVHFYTIQWSVSQDISIKGKLIGEKDKWYNKKVKSMGYMTWTSYSAFLIFHMHIYKTGNKTYYKEICFSSHHALAFTCLGGIGDPVPFPSILFLEEELLMLLVSNQNIYGAMGRIITFESDKRVTWFCPSSSAYDSQNKAC